MSSDMMTDASVTSTTSQTSRKADVRTIDLRGQQLSPADMLAAVPRATQARAEALETAARIVEDVRTDGEAALRDQAEKFDRVTGHEIRVPAEHIAEALESVDPAVREALENAIERVRRGSAAQVPSAQTTQIGAGALITQRWQPIGRAGVYIPGGKAALASSVVMNVVPAQVAGVSSIALASPPQIAHDGRCVRVRCRQPRP
jgi:histidinol dehydrogenase